MDSSTRQGKQSKLQETLAGIQLPVSFERQVLRSVDASAVSRERDEDSIVDLSSLSSTTIQNASSIYREISHSSDTTEKSVKRLEAAGAQNISETWKLAQYRTKKTLRRIYDEIRPLDFDSFVGIEIVDLHAVIPHGELDDIFNRPASRIKQDYTSALPSQSEKRTAKSPHRKGTVNTDRIKASIYRPPSKSYMLDMMERERLYDEKSKSTVSVSPASGVFSAVHRKVSRAKEAMSFTKRVERQASRKFISKEQTMALDNAKQDIGVDDKSQIGDNTALKGITHAAKAVETIGRIRPLGNEEPFKNQESGEKIRVSEASSEQKTLGMEHDVSVAQDQKDNFEADVLFGKLKDNPRDETEDFVLEAIQHIKPEDDGSEDLRIPEEESNVNIDERFESRETNTAERLTEESVETLQCNQESSQISSVKSSLDCVSSMQATEEELPLDYVTSMKAAEEEPLIAEHSDNMISETVPTAELSIECNKISSTVENTTSEEAKDQKLVDRTYIFSGTAGSADILGYDCDSDALCLQHIVGGNVRHNWWSIPWKFLGVKKVTEMGKNIILFDRGDVLKSIMVRHETWILLQKVRKSFADGISSTIKACFSQAMEWRLSSLRQQAVSRTKLLQKQSRNARRPRGEDMGKSFGNNPRNHSDKHSVESLKLGYTRARSPLHALNPTKKKYILGLYIDLVHELRVTGMSPVASDEISDSNAVNRPSEKAAQSLENLRALYTYLRDAMADDVESHGEDPQNLFAETENFKPRQNEDVKISLDSRCHGSDIFRKNDSRQAWEWQGAASPRAVQTLHPDAIRRLASATKVIPPSLLEKIENPRVRYMLNRLLSTIEEMERESSATRQDFLRSQRETASPHSPDIAIENGATSRPDKGELDNTSGVTVLPRFSPRSWKKVVDATVPRPPSRPQTERLKSRTRISDETFSKRPSTSPSMNIWATHGNSEHSGSKDSSRRMSYSSRQSLTSHGTYHPMSRRISAVSDLIGGMDYITSARARDAVQQTWKTDDLLRKQSNRSKITVSKVAMKLPPRGEVSAWGVPKKRADGMMIAGDGYIAM